MKISARTVGIAGLSAAGAFFAASCSALSSANEIGRANPAAANAAKECRNGGTDCGDGPASQIVGHINSASRRIKFGGGLIAVGVVAAALGATKVPSRRNRI